jgi:hypothetical protein
MRIFSSLINSENHREIYQKKEEILYHILKVENSYKNADKMILSLLTTISRFSDFEFLCKIVYENPQIYPQLKARSCFPLDQALPLLKSILRKGELEYFELVYDLLPSKSPQTIIESILIVHLESILMGVPTKQRLRLLDYLFDLVCSCGDFERNRSLLCDTLREKTEKSLHSEYLNKLVSGILLFNLVCTRKYLHVLRDIFIRYEIKDNRLEVQYQQEIKSIAVLENHVILNSCSYERKEGIFKRSYLIHESAMIVVEILGEAITCGPVRLGGGTTKE